MKIYTKTGDTGETRLYKNTPIDKDHARIEVIGEIDELNASIGFARSILIEPESELDPILAEIQNDLFSIGADLAAPNSDDLKISEDLTQKLEKFIDLFEDQLPPIRKFILPGGSQIGAILHLSRTICRRAERHTVRLSKSKCGAINPEILRYLNRLSDLLFVLARIANRRSDRDENFWRSS